MLITLFYLLILLTTTNLHTAAAAELPLLSPEDLAEIIATGNSDEPLPVDPHFNWSGIFFEGHYPCLEGEGCKEKHETLPALVEHLKIRHTPLPSHTRFTCDCLNEQARNKGLLPHGIPILLQYRTTIALHWLTHQRWQKDQQTPPKKEVDLRRSKRKRKQPKSYGENDCSDDEKDAPQPKRAPANKDPIATCCGNLYYSKSALRFHKESQHSDIDFSCPYCNSPLISSSSLLLHLRTKHSKKKSPNKLSCRVNNCKREIRWWPMLAIHEAKCRAKLQASSSNDKGEDSAGDPDDL